VREVAEELSLKVEDFCEVDGVPEAVAREALRKAGAKLPVKVRIISRNDM
jgi:ribosomal protein L16/L10AE